MRTRTVVVFCVLLVTAQATVTASDSQADAPLADAGLDQTVRQGATVHLDATGSRDSDGEIVGYEWRIETPGGTVTTPECTACARTTFVAAQLGTYEATVEVTDGDGMTRNDTLYVTVESPPDGPTVSLSGPTRPTIGGEVRYTVSVGAGDAPVETLVWYVGGERVARRDAEASVSLDYTFETTGQRTVTATVYDGNGREASDELTVRPRMAAAPPSPPSTGSDASRSSTTRRSTTVRQPTPSLTVSGPTTVFAADQHSYLASTDDVPAGEVVRWRDGDEGRRVTRTWDSPGTYVVAASATAHERTVSDSLTVNVIDPSVEIVGPTEVKTEIFASFSARTSGMSGDVVLRWNNGETGDTTGRKWSDPGTYTLKVTTTVAGRRISDTHTVNVTELVIVELNDPPKVDIDDPGSLTAGVDESLTATYSDPDGRVVDVEWKPARTVTVPQPGSTLVVSVTVTDDDGAQAADSITLQTQERGLTEQRGVVKCYYEDPYEKVRNAPKNGCKASWGESWTRSEVSVDWGNTVGRYDVTWVKIETNDATGVTETATTNDPVRHCMGCNNLRDADAGSNPTRKRSGETTSTTTDGGSYRKNGRAVQNDLTGDGVINVIDWNRRFDNGYLDGPGGGNSILRRAGPGYALRGANGQQVGTGFTPRAKPSGSDTTTSATSSPTGGNDVPNHESANPGGTNGQVDTKADGGRAEGQSVRDYKEEFTARLAISI